MFRFGDQTRHTLKLRWLSGAVDVPVSQHPLDGVMLLSHDIYALCRAYNGQIYQRGVTGSRLSKVPYSVAIPFRSCSVLIDCLVVRQIHPNDIIRFEVDMDAGNCRAFVNGADQVCVCAFLRYVSITDRFLTTMQGVVFTDLLGLEVFPAVCFYSSSRAVSLVKVPLLSVTIVIDGYPYPIAPPLAD